MDFKHKIKQAKRLTIANWVFISLQLAALTLGIVLDIVYDMSTATQTMLFHFAVYFVYNLIVEWIAEYSYLRVMYPNLYPKSTPTHRLTRKINVYRSAKMCGDSIACTLILQSGMKTGVILLTFVSYAQLLIS